ncbi:MAG TPA: DUF885 domain-containing protein, partial [Terriglobia bacterium]|nr:DUF885 domain-containing protein [Terriglobia bacterium]
MTFRARMLLIYGIVGLLTMSLWAETQFESACGRLAESQGRDAQRLHELFKLDWEHTMRDSPEFATMVGFPGQNDRWSDLSMEAIQRRKEELKGPIRVIQSIDRAKLNPADQLSYDLFKKNYEDAIQATRFKSEYIRITQMDGVQQEVARVLELAPRNSLKDYEDLLARLSTASVMIDQSIALLRKGVQSKITPPRITLRDVPQQIKNQMVEDANKNALLASFRTFPDSIPRAEQERLRNQAQAALKEKVIPAFGNLLAFFEKEYLPNARQGIAMSDLPDGKAWYAHNVRLSTTTSLTPEQIHKLGLSEVKRIRHEMESLIAQIGFKGSFDDFSTYLRTDTNLF